MSDEAGGDLCREVIRYVEAHDPTPRQAPGLSRTREDERADDLADLAAGSGPRQTPCCTSFDARL